MRVLVTNGLQRKSLAAVRSLGGRGDEVFVGERTMLNPSAFSRYAAGCFTYADPVENPEEFAEELNRTAERIRCDLIMLMDDDVIEATLPRVDAFSNSIRLAMPPESAYWQARDKGVAVGIAAAAGLDTPQTRFPSSREDGCKLAAEIGYPLVAKPRKGSGSRGIRVITSDAEFADISPEAFSGILLQEYIPIGPRYDVCLLVNRDHEVRASFVQREVRHYPEPMGPSSVQESVHLPNLIEACKPLVKRLGYVGILEVEFMLDVRTGRFVFMEINPRFWNSLYLSVVSGVDFPWLYREMMFKGDVPPVHSYKTGVFCKSMLPADTLHFVSASSRWRMQPPLWAGPRRGVYDDIVDREDIGPTLGFFAAVLRLAADRDVWRAYFRR